MDDEKKYKEALKKLQEALAPKNGCEISGLTRACIEEIFPELKESEDERIREEIIATIHLYYGEPLEDEAKEMISWLEKQGKKTQGKSALEAIKEEKVDNSNKVETKFHEGDWIVDNDDGDFFKVTKVREHTYCITGIGDEFDIQREVLEDNYHKFTIQDAKDGDVLYSLDSNQPFIYKERNMHGQATAYCGINKYGKFFVWNTKDCIITLDKYIPATKEQRDTLMKAMADAGYEWDMDKKELKLLITNGGDFFESKNWEQNSAWNNGYSNGYIQAIEKAVEWLENHNDYIDVKDGNVTYFDMEKCVEDFKIAMEGSK